MLEIETSFAYGKKGDVFFSPLRDVAFDFFEAPLYFLQRSQLLFLCRESFIMMFYLSSIKNRERKRRDEWFFASTTMPREAPPIDRTSAFLRKKQISPSAAPSPGLRRARARRPARTRERSSSWWPWLSLKVAVPRGREREKEKRKKKQLRKVTTKKRNSSFDPPTAAKKKLFSSTKDPPHPNATKTRELK